MTTYRQEKLDVGSHTPSMSSLKRAVKLLLDNPMKSINMICRKPEHPRDFRAQVRFIGDDRTEVERVRQTLQLKTKIEDLNPGYRVTVTRRDVVRDVLKLLLEHMPPLTQQRAMFVIECLDILDTFKESPRKKFPPERLLDIMYELGWPRMTHPHVFQKRARKSRPKD